MDAKNNPPAFPYAFHFPDQDGEPSGINFGMSLRDYFAGQALAGMLASTTKEQKWSGSTEARIALTESADLAMAAYTAADAMLSARKHKEPDGYDALR